MKINVVTRLYDCPDRVAPVVRPWKQLSATEDVEIIVLVAATPEDKPLDNQPTLDELKANLWKEKATVIGNMYPMTFDEAMEPPIYYLRQSGKAEDLLWIVDAHDTWSPELIQKVLEAVKANPDYGIFEVSSTAKTRQTRIYRLKHEHKVVASYENGKMIYISSEDKVDPPIKLDVENQIPTLEIEGNE